MSSDIIAMIPARIGSTRLSMKNLALLDGEPLIAHVIETCKGTGLFDRIVINSDCDIFAKIAERYGVEFYHRPEELGSSETKSDQVVSDFISNHPCKTICWMNSISPLQSVAEVQAVIHHFRRENLDSLITTSVSQVHANYDGQPLNYSTTGLFAKTQDLKAVEFYVYSIMMWNTEPFQQGYQRDGYAFFVGKVGFYPVSYLSSIIIKRQEDLQLAECIIQSRKGQGYTVEYDEVVQGGNS